MKAEDFSLELDGIRDELAVLPTVMGMGTEEADRHARSRTEELRRQLQDLDIILQLHMTEGNGQTILAEIGRLRRLLDESQPHPLLGLGRMPICVGPRH